MLCEYTIEHNKPVIHHWRRENRKKIHTIDRSFEPYFYAPTWHKVLEDERIKRIEKGYTNIKGEKYNRVYCDIPRSVSDLRNDIPEHNEADILFPIRYLIDKEPDYGDDDLRKCYLDIEVNTPGEFPKENEARFPIVSNTIYDNYLNKYITFFLDKNVEEGEEKKESRIWKSRITGEKIPWDIYRVGTERHLLSSFARFVRETNPDLFLGWNLDFFDIPYIINRMKNIGLDPGELSPLGTAYVKPPSMKLKTQRIEKNHPTIKGRVCFDLLPYYRRLHITQLSSGKLDNVAKEELGVKKLEYKGDIFGLYDRDPETLLKYNLADVELCLEIDRKREVVDFFWNLAKFIGCPLEDTLMNSKMADVYMLRTAKKQGIILPSKKPTIHFTVEGAIVLDPKIGFFKDITILDLKRIYPSIIVSCNMSPETLDPEGEIIMGNGVRFNKKKAFLPEVLRTLFELRRQKEVKRNKYPVGSELYNQYGRERQFVKDLINSIYGMMLYEGFRLYTPDVGRTVTWTGRNLLRNVKSVIQREGYKVLYGDTDSIFVQLPKGKTLNEKVEMSKNLEKKINDSMDAFAAQFNIEKERHCFVIEFEKLFSSLLLVAKKKYAGRTSWVNGKPDRVVMITGLETKKSDVPFFSRKLQRKVIDMILDSKPKKELMRYLYTEMKNIKELKLNEIGIPKGLQKDLDKYKVRNPWVDGCKYANQNLGTHFAMGSKPKMVYIKRTPPGYPRTKSVCFDYPEQIPEGFEVDWEKMTDRLIKQKVVRIIEAMGWNWIETDIYMTKLTDFGG